MLNFFVILQFVSSEDLYLFPNDSMLLDPYDYFSGCNLELHTSNPSVSIFGNFQYIKISDYSYMINSSFQISNLKFQQLVSFKDNQTMNIIDYYGNEIFVFSLDLSENVLTLIKSILTNSTIQEMYLWYNNSGKIVIICKNQVNSVYILELIDQDYRLTELDFWDLRYLDGLRSCEVDRSNFIPFIGNYQENYNIILLFSISEENLIPQAINSFLGDHGILLDLVMQDFGNGTLEIFTLIQNFGLQKITFDYHNYSSTIEILKLPGNDFTNIAIISSPFYQSSIQSNAISVGCQNGSYVIQSNSLDIMFFLKSSPNTLMTYTSVFNSYHLAINQNLSLLVFNDSVSSQDLIYSRDFSPYIHNFYTSKWYFFQLPFNSMLLMISSEENLFLFNLSIIMPNIIVNTTNSNYSFTLQSDMQEVKSFQVNLISDINQIYFLCINKKPKVSEIRQEIIFDGFSKNFSINPYSLLSGRNMKFALNGSGFSDDIFNLSSYGMEKLPNLLNQEINFKPEKVLVFENKIFMINENVVYKFFWDGGNLLSNGSLKFDKIFDSDAGLIGPVIGFEESGGKFIYYEELQTNFTVDEKCEYLKIIHTYIACWGFDRVYVYNLTQNNESNLILDLNLAQYNLSIIDVSVFNHEFNNYIVILDSSSNICIVSLELEKPYNSSCISSPESSYKLESNFPYIFIFSPGIIKISQYPGTYTNTVDLPEGKFKISNLNNFLYLSQSNHLIILDGSRSKLTIYYLDTSFEANCSVVGSGFYHTQTRIEPLVFVSCISNDKNYIKIYTSSCPIYGNSDSCDFLLNFFLNITDHTKLNQGEYYRNFSIVAYNHYSKVDFNVYLKLIAYGQAALIVNEKDLDVFNRVNYDKEVKVDLLQVFSGNNVKFGLKFNGEAKDLPVKLTSRISFSNVYSSNSRKYSLTSIPYMNILLFSSDECFLNLYNTTSNETFMLGNCESFMKNVITCPSIRFVFDYNPYIYLVAICEVRDKTISNYSSGSFKPSTKPATSKLFLINFNLSSKTLLDYTSKTLGPLPQMLNLVYEKSSSAYLLLITKIQLSQISNYLNNEIRIIKISKQNSSVVIVQDKKFNFRDLELNRLYSTSIDGVFQGYLYIAIANYYSGAMIFMYDENQLKIVSNISHLPDDPFITVGFTYKVLNIITLSGKILYYKYNQNLTLKYYVTRYPYTLHGASIMTVPSWLTYEQFYFNNYLVFPVTYDYNVFYYRIIDDEARFSSSIIQDVEFERPQHQTFNFHIEFIDPDTCYFIESGTDIRRIYLSSPILYKSGMTHENYKKLLLAGNESFSFEITAKNDNNECSSKKIQVNILGYYSSSSSEASARVWLIAVISVVCSIVLIITSLVVYRCIFKKRNKKIELAPSTIEYQELKELIPIS